MKLSQLLEGICEVPLCDSDIAGITCDSRRVSAGWAFVCISGTAADGHDYAIQAEQSGAAVIIAMHDTGCAGQIIVDDTRTVWAVMCANWFDNPARKLCLLGVTGTNGKTSVTYMLKAVLEQCGYKVGLIGTIRNLIGDRVLPSCQTTPDPYDLQSMFSIMLAEGCTHAVMEVSSHALDQQRVAGCRFEAAVFTNLTQDHLDYHGSMENYLAAKRRLFDMCATAVINADDRWGRQIEQDLFCPVLTYSVERDSSDYTGKNIRQRPGGTDFELVGTGVIARVRLNMPGLFSVYNALAAASCALALGLPFDRIVEALSAFRGVNGRAEVVPTGRDFAVIIDYAHTPDALEKICKTLKVCCERLITLFGCGGDRDKTKRPKMGEIAARNSDFIIVTSDNPRSEQPSAIIDDILEGVSSCQTPYTVIENRADAIKWAIDNALRGDIILLAGKGHETYQILQSGRIHFDEREIVANALNYSEPD